MDISLTKEQQLILLGIVASIIVGFGVMLFRNHYAKAGSAIVIDNSKAGHQMIKGTAVTVHISGAVRREGVYKLKTGDRLLDAIEMAGGAPPFADLSAVNLAEPVKDGLKIVVPAKRISGYQGISGTGDQSIRGSEKTETKVNLNTADEKALDSLPGVGPATAKAIIEYRKSKGPFARIEQIMEIPRFGKSKFDKLKSRIII